MHKAKERLVKLERRHLVAACVIVVGIAAAIVVITTAMVARTQNQAPQDTANFSVSGKLVCLPHKNTSGPQTLECAYGIHTDDDRNYALEFGTYPMGDAQIGRRVHVKGMLAATNDSYYAIVGTIKITELTQP